MGRGKRIIRWFKRLFFGKRRTSGRRSNTSLLKQCLIESSQPDITGNNSTQDSLSSSAVATTPDAQHRGSYSALLHTCEPDSSHNLLDSLPPESSDFIPSLLPAEQDNGNAQMKPHAISEIGIATSQVGSFAFEVTLMMEKERPPQPSFVRFSAKNIRYEKAMAKWAQTLLRMERVELNHRSVLKARSEFMTWKERTRLVGEARKHAMKDREVYILFSNVASIIPYL